MKPSPTVLSAMRPEELKEYVLRCNQIEALRAHVRAEVKKRQKLIDRARMRIANRNDGARVKAARAAERMAAE